VKRLPAAHWLLFERGRAPRLERYWSVVDAFRLKRSGGSLASCTEELAALVDDCVRLRMVADVPLGAFLSGGLDSSAVVAAMTQTASGAKLQSFCAGFKEVSYDEAPSARAMAERLHTEHREILVSRDQLVDCGPVLRAMDEPIADTSFLPLYHVAALARRHVTVSLSGDGGDELFAGYATYAADTLRRWTSFVPGCITRWAGRAVDNALPASFAKVSWDYKMRRFLRGHHLVAPQAHFYWRTIFDADERMSILKPDHRRTIGSVDPFEAVAGHYREIEGCAPLDQHIYVDLKTWLVDDILIKLDRATMAHGLEARAPLLDHRLVEFAARLPTHWKRRGLRGKLVFRESQRSRLPTAVVEQRKRGFNAPVAHWLLGPWCEWARAASLGSALDPWIDRAAVEGLWLEHRLRRRDHSLKLFGLACLGDWLDRVRQEVSTSRRYADRSDRRSPLS
jgi:asparagine synthase (glutamine-hydrolysing)